MNQRFHRALAWITLVVGPVALAAASQPSPAHHWAFQPVRPTPPPSVRQSDWPRTAIDRFVLAQLEEGGLAPAPPAGLRTLLRRAAYDLTGLPPAPEDFEALEMDAAPGAFDRAVERLLASPHYGERWGRHWLDVVRYADTAGENSDHPLPHAWRYRNWVIDAFNADQPYDAFIRDQVAGDLMAASGPPEAYGARIVATGFLAIARRFGHDIDKDMHLTIEDTIDTVGKSVLGLTLGCARCHDHKNDPVSARDYYGLYGIFESTRFAFPGCEPMQQPRDLVPLLTAAQVEVLRRPFEEQLAALDATIKALDEKQAALAKTLTEQATNNVRLLAGGDIPEGGSMPISSSINAPLLLTVKPGEVIRLIIHPRGNYGADTTLLEFHLEESKADGRRWSLAEDVSGDFLAGNPHADRYGHAAAWCFLDARQDWKLLPETVRDHQGNRGLNVWRNGDNPSAFVNATDQPMKVWTTLPPRTFFVHPAPDGPVAVAWLSPVSGALRITGRVADAHPAGGDGVAWKLEHIAASLGPGLEASASVARALSEPLRRRAELKSREPKVPVAYAVAEGAAKNAKLQKRGDPEQPGEEVPRQFLEILGGQRLSATNQSGRLELASWLTHPTNPLTARVMVNRIWQGHFGRGLVETPNDFGRQGRPPTHPALLDWLAHAFIQSGWSVKAMHRLILASAVYQQGAGGRGQGAGVRSQDAGVRSQNAASTKRASRITNHQPRITHHESPITSHESGGGNEGGTLDSALGSRLAAPELYSVFPRRRLTAEELRDTLLAVTGELDRAPGQAHPFPPEDKWNFTQHGPFADSYETFKRSVYVMQKRNRRAPFFALFDGPDPNASTAKRDVTVVPTQALYFMNDPFVHARAEAFAVRILAAGDDQAVRLNFAYRQLFGRPATRQEQEEGAEFLGRYAAACGDQALEKHIRLAWEAYARVLFSSNELLHLD